MRKKIVVKFTRSINIFVYYIKLWTFGFTSEETSNEALKGSVPFIPKGSVPFIPKGAKNSADLDFLIDENLIITNDIILAELVPYLAIKKESELISLLRSVERLSMEINWEEIIDFQVKCLENGINGIGLPDLIIAQNAKENGCKIYSLDKHFRLLNQVMNIQIYN